MRAAVVGVSLTLCALMGQAFPRTAEAIGVAILTVLAFLAVLAAVAGTFAGLPLSPRAVTLWGAHTLAWLGVICAALVYLTPLALNKLSSKRLESQAADWDAAVTFSSTLDFSLTATVYRQRPRTGQRLRAVYPRLKLPLVFLIRDAVGLLRTPKRLVLAVLTVVVASAFLQASSLSLTSFPVSLLLTAAAGLLLYGALGTLGQGLRHAAHAVADYPLYGISNRVLIAYHAAFPLTSSLVIVAGATALSAFVVLPGFPAPTPGISFLAGLLNGTPLVTLVLIARLTADLKGPLSPRLLAPIDTPFGDLSIVVRLAWALSGPLLAVIAGITVALLPVSPVPLIMTVACMLAALLRLWGGRAAR